MYIPKTLPLLSHATVTKQQKPSAFAENTSLSTGMFKGFGIAH